MAENNSGPSSSAPPRTFAQLAKQAGLFVLFGIILLIPRLRRLRRRLWAWTGVRLAAVACGAGLLWRFAHARAGIATPAWGLLLLASGLLLRAKPLVKSVDALAGELDALIVLNGGIFRRSPNATPIPQTQIFVHPERIFVLGPRENCPLEIPFVKVRSLAANPVPREAREGAKSWEVEIQWMDAGPCVTTFHYNGAFAEHLARVTESTLRSQWKKELPVLQPSAWRGSAG